MKPTENKKQKLTEAEGVFAGELLDLLHSEGIEISAVTAQACTVGIKMVYETILSQNQKVVDRLQERQHRDSLEGQEKLDYVFENFKKCILVYRGTFQDTTILPLALKEQQVSDDWERTHDTITYIKGCLQRVLGGCSESFRGRIVAKYRAEILQGKLSKEKEEQAEQDATDEYLALTNNKTTAEIQATTKVLKEKEKADELFEEAIDDLRTKVSHYTPAWREKLLMELLNETSDMVDNETRLASMEDKIRKFYDDLDTRTKLILEIGSQISCVESTAGSIKYGQDLIHRRFEDHRSVIAAIKELSDDPEIAYLGEAYMLAHLICED